MSEFHQGLPYPRRVLAVFAMSLGSMMLMIDASIAGVALPTIAKQLQVESSSTVLIVTVYQLILAMTLLPFAALGERIGHRRLYQAGLLLNAGAALLSFFADSLVALIAVRALQALGTAAALSVSVALVRLIYPLARLGGGLGINTIANATGTALAPVVGGFILSIANWHWAFVAVVPFSLASLIFSRALPDPEPHKLPFDVIGAALCALTFGLVISGLEGVIHTAHMVLSLGVVAVGAIVAWLFVRHEMRQSDPVLPIDLLKLPVVALSILSCLAAMLSSISLILFMPFRLQHVYGFSPGEIGGMMAAYALASLMIAPTAGYLSDRIPVALLSMLGMVIATIALICVAFLPSAPTHFDIAWRMWLCGAGFGMFFSPNARLIVGSAPPKRAASAGSMFTTTRMFGQATGATLVAALLAVGLGEGAVPAMIAMCLAIAAGGVSVWSLLFQRTNELR